MILQCTGALEGTVACRAKDVVVTAGNAHGKTAEGSNARAFIIGGEEWSTLVADGEDSIGIADSEGRASTDLHGALGLVDGLDESAVETLKKLVRDDLSRPRHAVDEIANDLGCVSQHNQRKGLSGVPHTLTSYPIIEA